MGKQGIISLLLCTAITLGGCAGASENTVATVSTTKTTTPISAAAETMQLESAENAVFSDRDMDASYSEADAIPIVFSGSGITCNSNAVEISGTTATIRKAGTYLLSGKTEDGSVIVDADKTDKIQLVLNGMSIRSEASAPIYVRQADKVFVTLAAGAQNSLSNGGSFTADGDTNIDSVIFSKDDLTLNGTGSLTITSPAGHGIVSKDSLRITGGTYAMDVSSHGLSGKDDIRIADGSFDIIAGKDGIHAENSDDAASGIAYLEGGVYRITAGGDGISASADCQIAGGDYTITAGGGSENGTQYTSEPGFDRGQKNGSVPSDRPQFDTQDFPERGTGGKGGMGSKGMGRGNQQPVDGQDTIAPATETDTVSTKGIKAASLTIAGGSFQLDCADDGLHSGGALSLRGGTFEIASGDDGIHADETVTVESGSVNITESYEGIEGQHVAILGGEITLTAADDGLNAAGGMDGSGFGHRGDAFAQSGDPASIVISGGSVHITASADGIDANGTLEITGGTVWVSGPTYGDTAILDFDRSGTISGGTFIGTGASSMAQTFSDSAQGVISANVGTQSAGTEITLADSDGNVILSYTPELDFTAVILSSPEIQSGERYVLNVGGSTGTFAAK